MVFKFFKGCFPQTLFGPLLNTFSQLTIVTKLSNLNVYEGSGEAFTYCISSSKSMYQMHTFTFLEEFVIKLHKKMKFSIKVELSPSKKHLCYLLHWRLFKNDEKCFLFHFKSSFHSQDIEVFDMTFCHELQ